MKWDEFLKMKAKNKLVAWYFDSDEFNLFMLSSSNLYRNMLMLIPSMTSLILHYDWVLNSRSPRRSISYSPHPRLTQVKLYWPSHQGSVFQKAATWKPNTRAPRDEGPDWRGLALGLGIQPVFKWIHIASYHWCWNEMHTEPFIEMDQTQKDLPPYW